jgi:two-component system phosphate regulon sensor histidine kinase PhoR
VAWLRPALAFGRLIRARGRREAWRIVAIALLAVAGAAAGVVAASVAGVAVLALAALLLLLPPRRGPRPAALGLGAIDQPGEPSNAPLPPQEAPTGWRQLIDALPDAAMALSSGGDVLHLNRQLVELMPGARVGVALTSFSRSPELLQAIADAQARAEPCLLQIDERVPVRRKLLATLSPLDDGGQNNQPGFIVVVRDATEQERLAELRADFIANASHELRTPLASLRGFVETLQGPARGDPAARERFLAIMASQAARMTRLIDDLLSLSRVEMRVHVAPRGEVMINEVLADIREAMAPVALEARTSLAVKPITGDAAVRGDRDELFQVFQNLVHNAIKYGRPGGHVELQAVREPALGHRGPARIAIGVSDDGPGIAPEHLPRLTERFYRVNTALSREKGGTGLGLAIVKHIVSRHRGDLRIISDVGRGSTFTVVFDEIAGGAPAVENKVRVFK